MKLVILYKEHLNKLKIEQSYDKIKYNGKKYLTLTLFQFLSIPWFLQLKKFYYCLYAHHESPQRKKN